jgi:hypothetical protein
MVSKETDLALRSFLGNRGARKGDLSKFIEEAVRWRMFRQNLDAVRAGFDDMSSEEAQALADEALKTTRKKRTPRKST